jgi:hypothetical protein
MMVSSHFGDSVGPHRVGRIADHAVTAPIMAGLGFADPPFKLVYG